jgi:hypothetical protein
MMRTSLLSHVGGPKWFVGLVRFARANFSNPPLRCADGAAGSGIKTIVFGRAIAPRDRIMRVVS